MKSVSSICKVSLVTTLVLVAVSVWAADSKGSLELRDKTNVAGKTLAAGNYAVRWEGTGDQVELKIYRGKNEVASVPARLIQMTSPASSNNVVVDTASDGSRSLSEIRFGGKKFALQFGAEAGSSGSAGAAK